MVNELTKAIARAIKREFQKVDIFTEQLEQGFESPCFFVLCISQKEQDRLDVRFLAEHTFVISYFPQQRHQKKHCGCCRIEGGNEDCWKVQSKLNRLLELIALDDGSLVHGTNRSGEIKEGVLHFFVNYDFYMLKEKPKNSYMEVLEVHEKTRRK